MARIFSGTQPSASLYIAHHPGPVNNGAELQSHSDSFFCLRHSPATAPRHTPPCLVRSSVVSFAVVAPADPLLGQLMNDAGKLSRVDTTDATGSASRRIFLTPVRLTALTDSITVRATVKYRGADVRGSPLTFVLKVKPGTP